MANHFGAPGASRPPPKCTSAGATARSPRHQGPGKRQRALEVAAAGGHNLLMIGPPGAGKSMLAHGCRPSCRRCRRRTARGLDDRLGRRRNRGRRAERPPAVPRAAPFGLDGGAGRRRPPHPAGRSELAHNGVLFLDELPEFAPSVLDSLRQPLESGETVSPRQCPRHLPARFQLVAAMNPCKCGLAGEPGHTCKRGRRLRRRLPGARLGAVPGPHRHPHRGAGGERRRHARPAGRASATVAARVRAARDLQRERYAKAGHPEVMTNAAAPASLIEAVASPTRGPKLLRRRPSVSRCRPAPIIACEGRAHARRSRRRRENHPAASGRGAVVSRARRRSCEPRGVIPPMILSICAEIVAVV